jgi:hypothetical protein
VIAFVVGDRRYAPNPDSRINPEHLAYFQFIGRVIGKVCSSNCVSSVAVVAWVRVHVAHCYDTERHGWLAGYGWMDIFIYLHRGCD